MKQVIILAGLCFATHSMAEKWNRQNNPEIFRPLMKQQIIYDLAQLPLDAKIQDDRFGWSDSYWPSNLGGIAYRWSSLDPMPFKYKFYSKSELSNMNEAQLGELSPAELYDISQGDYSYTLTKKVLKTYNPKDLWWEGICHGWALAATNYAEPDKVILTNKDGINVPFGASDVKALLSMHDAYNSKGYYVRVGKRCSVRGKVEGEAYPQDGVVPPVSKRDAERDECRDVNAGTFHLILTNMIGINASGFVADVDRYGDVWNQPITSYTSEVHEELKVTPSDIRSGIAKKIRVTTTMVYGDELEFYSEESEKEGVLGFVSKDPVTGTDRQTFSERNYEYVLELNASGRIIGGEWISESRPDMLWTKKKDAEFLNGKFPLAGLNKIYKPVQR